MAADLHDTIEQQIAGVKMLLTAALSPEATREESNEVIRRASEIVIRMKKDVRDVVMNLRNNETTEDSPVAGIVDVAKRMESTGAIRVRLALHGLPAKLEVSRNSDLKMIVREAIMNGVKHGKAKNIVILARGRVLRVLNDGSPFSRRDAPGPEAGHLGLAGMEDRAKKSGFSLKFIMVRRWSGVEIKI